MGFATGWSRRLSRSTIVAVAVGAVALLAACGGGGNGESGGGGGGGGTIKVGQITTQSGGYPFADTVKGTQSYVNLVNASGGIDGYQVELVAGDDKGDSGEAAQMARKLVQQDRVVGMVGNTSLVDCQTNRGFYESNKIGVVGGGTQTDCFTQPNWAPVNAGPFVGHAVMWKYLVDVVKPKAICGIDQNDPASQDYFEQLRTAFEAESGVTFKSVTYTNDSSQNPTPAVTNAKTQGCDAIYMSTVAPNFAAFVKAAKTVGLDATFIDAGSGYDVSLPDTLGADGTPGALGPNSKGVLVAAELAPVTDDTPGLKEMTGQFEKDGTPANFWSQIGWISAKVFFEGLKQGAGNNDITTPEGALNALKAMQPVDTGQAAVPLTFGPGDVHAPNLGSKVLLVNSGAFELAPGQAEGWTIVEPLPPPEK